LTIRNITNVCEEAEKVFEEKFPDNLKNKLEDDDDT
jgi:hypothetical protein